MLYLNLSTCLRALCCSVFSILIPFFWILFPVITAVCEQPCQNGGQCVAPNQCSCRLGFKGPYCEVDVDECAEGQDKCGAHSQCLNMPGWYACTCKSGFRSPLKDTLLGILCQGNISWRLPQTVIAGLPLHPSLPISDIDECAEVLHSCHGSSHCVNTIGGYECRCPPNNPNCSLSMQIYYLKTRLKNT